MASLKDEIKDNLQRFSDPVKQDIRNFKDDIADTIADTIADFSEKKSRPEKKKGGCLKYLIGILLIAGLLSNCGQGDNSHESAVYVPGDTTQVNAKRDPAMTQHDGIIVEAQEFRDGVAWVKYKFEDTTQWCCCDKEGNVLFVLEPQSSPTTHFANGVAIVDKSVIVNKSGEVIWSISQNGVEAGEELWGEGSIEAIELLHLEYDNSLDYVYDYYGYTVVRYKVDCFEYTGEKTGVLNSDGSWWLPPVSSSVFNAPFLGDEDGFYWLNSSNGERYYDIVSNQFIDPWDSEVDPNFKFRFDKHNGLIFQVNDYNAYPHTYGFYDADGNKIIDLSKYNINTEEKDPEFIDGYALLEIENDQGSPYYTIIDTSGNEMFAPRKQVLHDELSCGLVWVKENPVDGYYMNVYGEVAFDREYKKGSRFSEGLAYVYVEIDGEYYIHYINTNGEIVF